MTAETPYSTILGDAMGLVGGTRAALFLYDDLADGFSLVAEIGPDAQPYSDGVIAAADNVLTRCLEQEEALYLPVDRPVRAAFSSALSVTEPGQALLMPLLTSWVQGVLLVRVEGPVGASVALSAKRVAAETAEAALGSLSEAGHWCRFRKIAEVEPGGIAVVEEPDGVIRYANAALRHTLGLEGTPLLGRRASVAFATALGPQLASGMARVRTGGKPVHHPRFEVADQYGSRFYDMHLVPEQGMEDRAPAIYILVSNRTDAVSTRIALEQSVLQLADSKSLLSAVLDSTNNGILLIGTDSTVLYANGRLHDLFQLDAAYSVGMSHGSLMESLKERVKDPEAFTRRQAFLDLHLEDRLTDQVELIRPTTRILSRYSGPVYKEDGVLLGRIEVYTDVTEIQQLQRNKDEFLSVVSHELKTPVTSIKGYAQLLRRRADRDRSQESLLTSFGVIERQANRMQQLIETLLDLSRWDLGRLTFESRELDVVALVRRAVEGLELTNDSHRIELDLPASTVPVKGDEHRLEQVVTNLLLNAVRYSPEALSIAVRVEDGADARISVRDHGIGIAADVQSHVFERFYRGPGMTDLTGLGIGLYISKNIVERHGGRIELQSSVGVGSTFTVILPRLQSESAD